MTDALQGKTIAFLVSNDGVEQVELTAPWQRVEQEGGRPVLVAPESGEVRARNGDVDPGDTFGVDRTVGEVGATDFGGVVVPGGTTNADRLRLDTAAVDLLRDVVTHRIPVAAICHGPWMLVEADVVRGKTLTSFPSLRTDITNAGGTWTDVEVFVCGAAGWMLTTSRTPGDLPAFCDAMVEQFDNDDVE